MNIRAEKIVLELTNDEAYKLACHIKYSLEHSIDTHYISTNHDSYKRGLEGHAKPLFEEQCRKSLNMMNLLYACCNGDTDKWMEKELWLYLETKYKAAHGL